MPNSEVKRGSADGSVAFAMRKGRLFCIYLSATWRHLILFWGLPCLTLSFSSPSRLWFVWPPRLLISRYSS